MTDDPLPPTGLGLDDPARERTLLAQIISTVTAGLDLDDLVQGVAKLITQATVSDVCFVYLLHPDGMRIVLAGATPPFDTLAGRIELPLGMGVAGWVASEGRHAIVDDKFEDPRYEYIPELRGEDYASLVSVPMRSPTGPVIGVLNVHTRQPHAFADADAATLQAIADLVAGAVENAQLHHRLAEREHAREQFAERLVTAQEHERRHVAGEIHDGISQRIVGLSYHLAAARDALGEDEAFVSEQIEAARGLAAAALEETRTAIAGLRPSVLDDLGLAAGLESLVRGLPGVDVELHVDQADHLADHVQTALYRITQEALQNVAKHADAEHVVVQLEANAHAIQLVVADDGQGFEPALVDSRPGSAITYGLSSMRERADLIGARLEVTARPDEGTRITVTLPP